MKRYPTIALAVSVLAIAACKDNPVANPIDNPTVDRRRQRHMVRAHQDVESLCAPSRHSLQPARGQQDGTGRRSEHA